MKLKLCSLLSDICYRSTSRMRSFVHTLSPPPSPILTTRSVEYTWMLLELRKVAIGCLRIIHVWKADALGC